MYMALCFLAAAAMCLLLALTRRRHTASPWRLWAGWVVVNVLLLYTHYYGAFILAAEGLVVVWWMARDRRLRSLWKPWVASGGLVAISFLPWVPTMLRQPQATSPLPYSHAYGLALPVLTVGRFFVGKPFHVWALGLAALVLLAAGINGWISYRREVEGHNSAHERSRGRWDDDGHADLPPSVPPAGGEATTTPPARGEATTTPPARGEATTTPPAGGEATTTPPAGGGAAGGGRPAFTPPSGGSRRGEESRLFSKQVEELGGDGHPGVLPHRGGLGRVVLAPHFPAARADRFHAAAGRVAWLRPGTTPGVSAAAGRGAQRSSHWSLCLPMACTPTTRHRKRTAGARQQPQFPPTGNRVI